MSEDFQTLLSVALPIILFCFFLSYLSGMYVLRALLWFARALILVPALVLLLLFALETLVLLEIMPPPSPDYGKPGPGWYFGFLFFEAVFYAIWLACNKLEAYGQKRRKARGT